MGVKKYKLPYVLLVINMDTLFVVKYYVQILVPKM